VTGTALYITNLLAPLNVEVTRLARGITTGSILEYTNKEIRPSHERPPEVLGRS